MAGLLKNKFVYTSDKLNFSRSIFPFEKRHSTNLLSGYITPVFHQFLYPGTSPDYNFGCVIEAAPMISTCLDNVYVDIVATWTPARLVMTDWNEFLGESHTNAFTINRNIVIPKITTIDNKVFVGPGSSACSLAYAAEHCIGPHIGYRRASGINTSSVAPAGSIFKTGISVLPSRVYELNWNTFFRNENLQSPLLISTTSALGTRDTTYYPYWLGKLQLANKLKTWYTIATPAPSLLDVSLSLGELMPVIGDTTLHSIEPNLYKLSSSSTASGSSFRIAIDGNNGGAMSAADTTTAGLATLKYSNLVTDLTGLTVNKMYYALMEQRFANTMRKGRRAVEFYANFFGVQDSDAGHDLPKLLCQKRFPLNISQVIATASGTNGTDTTDLGQRGAYSTTGFGDSLIKNFTATEHGFLQVYMIIRGQPSLASGIDHELGMSTLLDTYIPTFDHIGPVGIEQLEILDTNVGVGANLFFGYTNAWYAERRGVSDCVGIIAPGQPMAYKTLALSYSVGSGGLVISNSFIRHTPQIIDRLFLFPVCYGTPGDTANGYDEFGEPFNSDRYQFITQFVVKGKFAAVMSPNSEPLQLRL